MVTGILSQLFRIMNLNLKTLAASLMLATSSLSLLAVPAKPGLIDFTQPDGSVVRVRIHGDEFHHFYTSEDGYYLAPADNGVLCYADVDAKGLTVSSGIRATTPSARTAAAKSFLAGVNMDRVISVMETQASSRQSRMAQTVRRAIPAFDRNSAAARRAQAGPGLFPGTHFPAIGDQKGLVIIVEYQDVKMTTPDALDYFTRMLNEPGFSDHEATGSAVDYFRECSNNLFRPQFDVYGIVTLPQNMRYYGGNDWMGNDSHAYEMVTHACELLDDEIDFREYDRDGDGYVDNVFVFYAGRGEASGGSADTVWPHSWDIEYGLGYAPEFDGVKINRYACTNEWTGNRPDGVGTFCHEFSHVMGLPDLYATSYSNSFTPGEWSALDYGPYNNNGCTPPLYSAFERYALGWLEPEPIDKAVSAILPPISSNRAGIVKVSDNEFFLFENRQQESWDTYIPGHGMLVWHVDYVPSIWTSNAVNNTPSHQYVDLEEADGLRGDYTRDGDCFPGVSNITSFTDDTTPSMRSWSGAHMETPITDISENEAGEILFSACGGNEGVSVATTTPRDADDVDDVSFTAAWDKAQGVTDATYSLSVYTVDDARSDGRVWVMRDRNVGDATSYRVEGLKAETEYFYAVRVVSRGWEYSGFSDPVSVTTKAAPLSKRTVTALPATDIASDGFTATWEKIDVATGYTLEVSRKDITGVNHDIVDFDSGVTVLPRGWSSSSTTAYRNDDYSGKSQPSLRMSVNGDVLTSPVYDGEVHSITFWHRGNNTSADDRIILSANTPSGYVEVLSLPVTTEAGGLTTTFDFDPETTGPVSSIRLEFRRLGKQGALAIDDIDVSYGAVYELVPVEGFSPVAVGDSDSRRVSGLEPLTTYVYTVTATDGTLVSLPSQVIEVTTADPSGLDDVIASTARLSVSGGVITVSGLAPGSFVTLTDIAGRLVAQTAADTAGRAVLKPALRGVYIVAAPASGLTAKVAL